MRARQFLVEYNRQITVNKFRDRILARGETDDPEALIKLFEDIDPTQNKQYVQWMTQRYSAGEFSIKDLVKLKNALYKFEYAKHLNLNLLEPDLGRYKYSKLIETIDELFPNDAAFPVIPGTKILWNGPNGQFVSPQTVEGSQALQKLGPPTAWCTADSRAPRHFNEFASRGPLYVWIDANRQIKVQFHPASGQINTPDNRRVNDDSLMTYLLNKPAINRVILPELVNNPKLVSYIPSAYWNKELAQRVVSDNGLNLQFVPNELITPVLARMAIEQHPQAIRFVPQSILLEYPGLCWMAVERQATLLQYVPDELKTPELIKLAISSDVDALYFVPTKYLNPEFLKNIDPKNLLRYLPLSHWDQELVDDLVKQHPENFLPVASRAPQYLTDELMLIGIKKYGQSIDYHLPRNRILRFFIRNPNLIMPAIRRDPMLIQHVPVENRTQEMIDYVVSRVGSQLAEVPYSKRTQQQSINAVKRNGLALEFVPEKYKSTALCMLAVSKNGKALRFVPEEKRTPKMIFTAYDNNKKAMRYLPKRYRIPKMYHALIKRNPYGIMYTPAKFVDREIMKRVLQTDQNWIRYIPDRAKIEYPDLSEQAAIKLYRDYISATFPLSSDSARRHVLRKFPEQIRNRIASALDREIDRSNRA